MGRNEENWRVHYEKVKAHVIEHGHFPDKHTCENNWVRYQRKRIKAGIMPDDQMQLFRELESMRSGSHTGGRKKKDQNTP